MLMCSYGTLLYLGRKLYASVRYCLVLCVQEENVKNRAQSRREEMKKKMDRMKGPRLRTNRHSEL